MRILNPIEYQQERRLFQLLKLCLEKRLVPGSRNQGTCHCTLVLRPGNHAVQLFPAYLPQVDTLLPCQLDQFPNPLILAP